MHAHVCNAFGTEIEIRITCAVVLGTGLLQLAVKVALWDMGSFPDGLDLRRLLGVACLMDHLGMPTTSEGAGAVS